VSTGIDAHLELPALETAAPTTTAPTTMREAFVHEAGALLDQDRRVALVLAAISADAFAPLARRHPDRVIDVGIREQLMIGVAGGMALAGMRPIAHTYAPFLIERAFEQVKLDLGHQGADAVLVSVGASYDWAEGGHTHRSAGDVALLDTLDGWHVHIPGRVADIGPLLRRTVQAGGRHYLRLTTAADGTEATGVPGDGGWLAHAGASPAADEMRVVRRGSAGTVIAVGPMLVRTLLGVADLDVTVLHALTVRPFDAATLTGTLGRPDVVLVEPYLAGTSAAVIARALADRPHRLLALGVGRAEARHYGTAAEHDHAHGLDPAGIRAAVTSLLERFPERQHT